MNQKLEFNQDTMNESNKERYISVQEAIRRIFDEDLKPRRPVAAGERSDEEA